MSNTKTKDVFITGKLTAVSPLTYQAPFGEAGQIQRIGGKGGKPYFPASALRGKLRRMARAVVYNGLGKKFNFDDFFYLTIGGLVDGKGKDEAEGSPKQSYAMMVQRAAEQFNPLISLFGAMSPLAIPSKLSIAHAVAMSDGSCTDIIRPCRSDDVRVRPAQTLELVDDSFEDLYLQRTGAAREGSLLKKKEAELRAALRKAEGVERESIQAQIAELEASKGGKGAVVSISQPELSYEVIRAGTDLDFTARIMRATDTELALLMKAIDTFAYEPLLGAKVNHGNGVVKGALTVKTREHGKLCAPSEVGTIAWNGDYAGATFVGEPFDWVTAEIPFDALDFTFATIKKEAA